MATVQFSNDKTIKDLRKEIEDISLEREKIRFSLVEKEDKVLELENSLAEEKKMQEEIGDEYESMQLQVQESSGRINELTKELDELKQQAVTKTDSNDTEELTMKIEELIIIFIRWSGSF